MAQIVTSWCILVQTSACCCRLVQAAIVWRGKVQVGATFLKVVEVNAG